MSHKSADLFLMYKVSGRLFRSDVQTSRDTILSPKGRHDSCDFARSTLLEIVLNAFKIRGTFPM